MRGARDLAGRRWWLACAWLCMVPAGAADIPQHALETRALVEPEAALREIREALSQAEARHDFHEQALLQLARANACRVVADWACQRDAGVATVTAARAAGDATLEIRGLIAEARGRIALQDYTRAEHLLGDAQLMLNQTPSPALAADVYLAYSSLSFTLGKHESAAQYAERGLAVLAEDPAPAMRTRLLRNRARAEAQLGQLDQARASLAQALQAVDALVDPKLTAELALESARVARLAGDLPTQRSNGERVLSMASTLQNSQLAGLGHEVMGLAALDSGDRAGAQRELEAAQLAFRKLGLTRDELRLTRQLMQLMVDHDGEPAQWNAMVGRFLELDRSVNQSDRAKAADDYEARIKYAEQELEVLRLSADAQLERTRAAALAESSRLSTWLTASALALLLILSGFFLQQRRSNRRLQAALAARRESEAKATDLLQLSKGMVFLHDLRGELVMVNLATAEALGESPDRMVGRALGEFLADQSRQEFDASLKRLAKSQQDEGTLVVRRRGDGLRHWRYSTRLSGSGAYAIGHAVDITEQLHETQALRDQSMRDALTQAYNRRYFKVFEERLGERPWSVINIDLDHFKRINDTQGHDAGDRVLIQMTAHLGAALREGDALVRSGGDEFVLLLSEGEGVRLQSAIARLRGTVEAAPCRYTVGAAVRQGSESLADTLARADTEMYAARRHQRGG